MKTKKGFYILGDSEIQTISDTYNGEYFDTEIWINEAFICTIEGDKIAEFIEKMQNIVNDYRI